MGHNGMCACVYGWESVFEANVDQMKAGGEWMRGGGANGRHILHAKRIADRHPIS